MLRNRSESQTVVATQLARVDVQGVSADGIVDTAADITIMGGKLFALVAAAAKLRRKNSESPTKSRGDTTGECSIYMAVWRWTLRSKTRH